MNVDGIVEKGSEYIHIAPRLKMSLKIAKSKVTRINVTNRLMRVKEEKER